MGSNPKPEVLWFKDGVSLPMNARIKPTITGAGNDYVIKLEITNFTKEDGGLYKVTAKNELGEGNANITINLQGPKVPPPTLKGPPEIKLDETGKIIIIRIGVAATELPDLTWTCNGKSVKDDKRVSLDCKQENGVFYPTLRLSNFTAKDSGAYKCVMKNAYGEAVATATLNVDALQPPKPKTPAPEVQGPPEIKL